MKKDDNKGSEILNIEVEKRFGEKDKYSIPRKDVPKNFMKFLECFIIGHINLVELYIEGELGYIVIHHDLGYAKIYKIRPIVSIVEASILITEYWEANDTYQTLSIKNTDMLNPNVVDFLNNDLKSLKEQLYKITKQ